MRRYWNRMKLLSNVTVVLIRRAEEMETQIHKRRKSWCRDDVRKWGVPYTSQETWKTARKYHKQRENHGTDSSLDASESMPYHHLGFGLPDSWAEREWIFVALSCAFVTTDLWTYYTMCVCMCVCEYIHIDTYKLSCAVLSTLTSNV